MGKKYIIEIGRLERLYKAFISAHGKPEITWLSPEVDLTPYTEPDLEQVRADAYEDGYKTAKIQCGIQAEKDMREVGKRHYQRGLSDAWGTCKKIGCYEIDGGYPATQMLDLFDRDDLPKILSDYTASEAIEKIRQYEQEKGKIQVGDEIENKMTKSKGVVVMDDKDSVQCLSPHGTIFCVGKSRCIRIGHFPEIAEVLAKMKES